MNSNFISEFVDDINIKTDRLRLTIKWIIRVSVFLIGGAFVFGQVKMARLNKLDEIQKSLLAQSEAMADLKKQVNDGFDKVNTRINNIYTDGYKGFADFQDYNKKQFELIIDYGNSDKELLKKMLELNIMEKTKSVENELQQERLETYNTDVPQQKSKNDLIGNANLQFSNISTTIISVNGDDTIFNANGCDAYYLNQIKKKYTIIKLENSTKFPNFLDVTYKNK